MELKNITKEEYKTYVETNYNPTFLQSGFAASKLEENGWTVEYLQGIDNGEIKATAMIGYTHLLRHYQYAYIPRGFFLNYRDAQLVYDFTHALKKMLKKKRVIYLDMDPYIIYRQRDKNGDIVEGGMDNRDIVTILEQAGFISMPRTRGYDTSKQCRWMSRLDLRNKTKEEVFANFSTSTRNDIRNAQKYGVHVRTIGVDELNILDYMEQEAGERHSFEAVTHDFFESMYRNYKDRIKTLYAYLNLDEYAQTIYDERQKTEAEVQDIETFLQENPNSKKKQKRLKVAMEYLESLQKKEGQIQDLRDRYQNEVPLACSMFIKYGREVVYLSSGSDYKYRVYRGPYAIQWHMIQEAIEEGYSYYNMYGISGYFEKGQDGYGVFDFKRGFNCEVLELIGRFHLPVYPLLYKLDRLVHKDIFK